MLTRVWILTRVTHGASQVNQSTLGKEDDVVSVGQGEPVNLGLDVRLLDGVLLQPLDADLAVKVTDVANDGVVLHPDQDQTRTRLKPVSRAAQAWAGIF